MKANSGFIFIGVILVAVLITTASFFNSIPSTAASLENFSSCSELSEKIKSAQSQYSMGWGGMARDGVMLAETTTGLDTASGGSNEAAPKSQEYSETNVQVAGVDEADVVKTDGSYIYTISNNKLIIVSAYPADEAQVLSETEVENFHPTEMFIDDNMLLVFGYNYEVYYPEKPEMAEEEMAITVDAVGYYHRYSSFTSVKLFDISDKSSPEEVRGLDFEGNYVSSRKIGSQVYFIVNSYPDFYALEQGDIEQIIPLYKDSKVGDIEPSCGCVDVKYFNPIIPQSFITIASIDMQNPDSKVEKEVILGSGQNVYASHDSLFVAETYYPYHILTGIALDFQNQVITEEEAMEKSKDIEVTTNIHKFSLENLEYVGNMQAPGTTLNQFSMDEHDNHFRIATTRQSMWFSSDQGSNSIYIFDDNLEQVGSIEDIAPGEQIYSARFMGDKGYLVTFKSIDPFFVLDLSDPTDPKILGKLKIPGYSDYLHPLDENHIIGIGKDAIPSENENFAWYQGMKLAVFDVTDVENPIELHKISIGDRGTNSPALHNHKAFLFDKEKQLLVIPILLAEIKDKENAEKWSYGDYIFQGAYVYDLSVEDGFNLKGTITHYDNEELFKKSGYYFHGDYTIERSLYIENILYTLSTGMIKMNSLEDLEEINYLEFGS